MTNILLFVTVAALFTTILGYNLGIHYASAQAAVSIAPGSSNPSASQFYVLPEITVSSGTTVTWTNDDSTAHTVTPGENAQPEGQFDSGMMAPAATFEHTFAEAGEYPYFCLLHPNMVGTVSVMS